MDFDTLHHLLRIAILLLLLLLIRTRRQMYSSRRSWRDRTSYLSRRSRSKDRDSQA